MYGTSSSKETEAEQRFSEAQPTCTPLAQGKNWLWRASSSERRCYCQQHSDGLQNWGNNQSMFFCRLNFCSALFLKFLLSNVFTEGFPCSSAGKESICNVWDLGWIPGLGRSPGEGNRYPRQYSSLENSMDCIVHGVAKSQTRLSDFHFHLYVFTNKQKREKRYHKTTTQRYYS